MLAIFGYIWSESAVVTEQGILATRMNLDINIFADETVISGESVMLKFYFFWKFINLNENITRRISDRLLLFQITKVSFTVLVSVKTTGFI